MYFPRALLALFTLAIGAQACTPGHYGCGTVCAISLVAVSFKYSNIMIVVLALKALLTTRNRHSETEPLARREPFMSVTVRAISNTAPNAMVLVAAMTMAKETPIASVRGSPQRTVR